MLAPASAAGSDRLYCLGTLATYPPGVAPNSVDSGGNPVVQYNFFVFPDCNANEIDDWDEQPMPPGCGSTCIADCDDGSGTGVTDGGVTIDELLYYITRFQGGC